MRPSGLVGPGKQLLPQVVSIEFSLVDVVL